MEEGVINVLESAVRLVEGQCTPESGASLVLALKKLHLRLGDAIDKAEKEPSGQDEAKEGRGPRKSFVPGMELATEAANAILEESPELRNALKKRRRFVARFSAKWRQHRGKIESVMGVATVCKLVTLTASYYPDNTPATHVLRRLDWATNFVFCLEILGRVACRNTKADRVWCLVVMPWAAVYWGVLYLSGGGFKSHGANVQRDDTARTTTLLLDTFTGLSVFRLRAIQKQVLPVCRALPVIVYPCVVLCLGLWLWSAIGFILFSDDHPAFFGTFLESFFTMWSFLTETAGGDNAKRLTHTCKGIPWGYAERGGDDEYAALHDETIHSFSEGEDTDDLVDCAPLLREMVFFYSFEIVMAFLVLNVLLGVVVDAVANARAEIVDAEYLEAVGGGGDDDDDGGGDENDDGTHLGPRRRRHMPVNNGHAMGQTGRKASMSSQRVAKAAFSLHRAADRARHRVDDAGPSAATPAESKAEPTRAEPPPASPSPVRVAPAEFTPVTPLAPEAPRQTARRAAAQPAPRTREQSIDPGVNAGRRETTHAPLIADFY